jgi:2-methylcitrate dehydratase PrpD
MGLDWERTMNAIAIAASRSSGISEWGISGGSVKRLHAGFAAESGVKAAFLAERGITGPSTVLEGKRGFCQAFADEYSLEEMTKDLGKEFMILRVGNKPYCCCAAQHSEIDAISFIMKERDLTIEGIEEVIVRKKAKDVGVIGMITEPRDITSAQFSGRFGIALRLIKGGNGFTEYSEKNLKDPDVLAMVKRIRYEVDEELENCPPDTAPAIVTVRLKDGSKIERRVDYAKGTPRNPMGMEELKNKFRDLASRAVKEEQVERIIENVDKVEEISDLRTFTLLLLAKIT